MLLQMQKKNIIFIKEQSILADKKIAFSLKGRRLCIITFCSEYFTEFQFSIYIYPKYEEPLCSPTFERCGVTLGNVVDLLKEILPEENWSGEFLESSHFNFLGNEPVQRQKTAFYKDLASLPRRFLKNWKKNE